jgi:UDP-galactopyranose mutase
MKKALILGGGVAGSSAAYFLFEKGYDVTIVEKQDRFGGLARTESYAGHNYEFGPHIWFWPGGVEDPINSVIHRLSNGELYFINRRLFSYIEEDNEYYKYPIHFEDIARMPEAEKIMQEMNENRVENRLDTERLPTIGSAKFADYFRAAIGSTLYDKFMKEYTHKMWNISGDNLETSMVWADRFNHEYSKESKLEKWAYDPIKFSDHTLGKGIQFQVYPKEGWNVIWEGMTKNAQKIKGEILAVNQKGKFAEILIDNGLSVDLRNYDLIINTLDLDRFFGDKELPYTGRLIIPLLLPDLEFAFPASAESIHYSGAEFMTRVTEMKQITQKNSKDTLLLLEVPVLPGAHKFFPENVIAAAESRNLYAGKAYPQQSKYALAYHQELVAKSREIANWHNLGRHAQFKYWGMPETVNSSFKFVQALD